MRKNVRSKSIAVTIHQAGFHLALCVRGERTISKRKEVYYETQECGSVLWDRKKEVTLWDRKNECKVRDKKELYL